MRFHLRANLALAAVVALNLAVHDQLGYFTPLAFCGVMTAFALALSASLLPSIVRNSASSIDGDLLVLMCTALAMTTLNVQSTHLSRAAMPCAPSRLPRPRSW